MKKLFLWTLLFILSTAVKSQVLLSPIDLIRISKLTDNGTITNILKTKGYEVGYGWEIEDGGKINNWLFQTRPGEFVDFTFRKVTWVSRKAETLYWISNKYFYKEFMNNLRASNFVFSDIRIIDNQCYFVFKKGKDSIFVIQKPGKTPDEAYFEIKIG